MRIDDYALFDGSGSTYNTIYQYDLADNLVKKTYPSGRVVTTTFDQVPRAQNVSGTTTDPDSVEVKPELGFNLHGLEQERITLWAKSLPKR